MKNIRKVTCRPCKEQDNWEIETPDGKVLPKHYSNKYECISVGRKLAEEYLCELDVQEYFK